MLDLLATITGPLFKPFSESRTLFLYWKGMPSRSMYPARLTRLTKVLWMFDLPDFLFIALS